MCWAVCSVTPSVLPVDSSVKSDESLMFSGEQAVSYVVKSHVSVLVQDRNRAGHGDSWHLA